MLISKMEASSMLQKLYFQCPIESPINIQASLNVRAGMVANDCPTVFTQDSERGAPKMTWCRRSIILKLAESS
jgi:hypothetical protein